MRVLVADDSGIIRDVMSQMLRRLGHDLVGVVKNGPDAVDLAEQEKPDLAIVDVSMPGRYSGADAAKMIREGDCARYIVVCTSIPNEYAKRCANTARAYLLPKPLHHISQLERAITAAQALIDQAQVPDGIA